MEPGTRRTFVKGVAAAGVATSVGALLDDQELIHLLEDSQAAGGTRANPLASFTSIAASSADELQVPEGFRADVLIRWGDTFQDDKGKTYVWGFNNDFLAFFPLGDGSREGLLFVNFEYPGPFFQSGYKPTGIENPNGNAKHTKTNAEIVDEMEAVGNAILHIQRNPDGVWGVVSPSKYNRRVYGGNVSSKGLTPTPVDIVGPLKGTRNAVLDAATPRPVRAIGTEADGTVGNCSGGITPWGTALSCEENYDGYGAPLGNADSAYGWDQVSPGQYNATTNAANESQLYGWTVEHDPYDPAFKARKHTALGRFRHENTAFRHVPGKKFVLYQGDDQANQGVYKFVSNRPFIAGDRANNLKILEEGTLYVAKFAAEGRRRFDAVDGNLLTAESGTGQWIKVETWELFDTRLMLSGFPTGGSRRAVGVTDPASPTYSGRFNKPISGSDSRNEWDTYFATNRPEDVEVDTDGAVYIAFTNNASVFDSHGSIRKLVEAGNDPEATSFTWSEFATGGQKANARNSGEQGFSSADNLVFDEAGNLWVVTDNSSASLKGSSNPRTEYLYHGNNAVFMIDRKSGVAFRFANAPIESESTGPYFTPDFQTLFLNIQHPGEETQLRRASVFGDPSTFTSYWPDSSKTRAGAQPRTPRPATVAIQKIGTGVVPGPNVVPPANSPIAPAPDRQTSFTMRPPASRSRTLLRTRGVGVRVNVPEGAGADLRLTAKIRGRTVTLAKGRATFPAAGSYTVRMTATAAGKTSLKVARALSGRLTVKVTDKAGNSATRTASIRIAR